MNKNSTMLPPDLSRDQLEALLERHWPKPTASEPIPVPAPEQVDSLVKVTFDVLMTRQFRVCRNLTFTMKSCFAFVILSRWGNPLRSTLALLH